MDGFSGILDTYQEENLQMVKEKLIDENKLQVGLKVN